MYSRKVSFLIRGTEMFIDKSILTELMKATMVHHLLFCFVLLCSSICVLGFPYKGMSYTIDSRSPLNSPQALQSLRNLKDIGVTWIALVVNWEQQTVNSTDIQAGSGTPADDVVRQFITSARGMGIDILLKPHVDPIHPGGTWRAWIGQFFTAAQWAQWFSSYTAFIVRYAIMAEQTNCKVFSAGVEYIIPSSHEQEWRQVISEIRKVYKGLVTYSANWGGLYDGIEGSEIDRLSWVDSLDIIGIDAYYPLTTLRDPTEMQIKDGWNKWVPRMKNISQVWHKDVIVTELGFKSVSSSTIHPGWWNISGRANLTQQYDAFHATFDSFVSESWWMGIFWWAWSSNPNAGGTQDTDYTPQHKPTETLIKQYYSSTSKTFV